MMKNITNFDEHLDLLSLRTRTKKDNLFDKNVQKGTYKKYSDHVTEHFFCVRERFDTR